MICGSVFVGPFFLFAIFAKFGLSKSHDQKGPVRSVTVFRTKNGVAFFVMAIASFSFDLLSCFSVLFGKFQFYIPAAICLLTSVLLCKLYWRHQGGSIAFLIWLIFATFALNEFYDPKDVWLDSALCLTALLPALGFLFMTLKRDAGIFI
jgi:hypothetical protein